MRDILVRMFFPDSIKDGTERLAYFLLGGSVAVVLVSVAASQFLLAFAIPASLWILMRKGKQALPSYPIALPLLLFFLWTVVVALISAETQLNLMALKKFFLYSILLLVPLIVRGPKANLLIYRWIFFFALCSSLRGIEQYILAPNSDLLHRITGFMGQWMTFSGLLMLVLVASLAYVLCYGWRRSTWVVAVAGTCVVLLILSLTRNAWLGTIAGLTVVLALLRPRAIAALAMVLVAAYLLLPPGVKQRAQTALNPNDPNTRNRIELFETAIRVIRENPWVGVGLKGVKPAALKNRGSFEYPDWMYQHMHNNFLQIAAERGIPGLLLWLWFISRLAWDALRVYRVAKRDCRDNDGEDKKEALVVSVAALGACAALLFAGLFEYNFGDSEVLTLFLFMMSAPYVYLRDWAADGKATPIASSGSGAAVGCC
jgi:putative inorganic carbon (hco3(-)) transporter